MYDFNDILARLEKGENAEAIAKEYADAMNKAIKVKADKDAAAAAAKKAAAEKKAEAEAKLMDAVQITDLIQEFCEEYYDYEDTVCSPEAFVELMDGIFELKDALDELKTQLEKKVPKDSQSMKVTFKDDKVINDFLKGLGLR